MGGIPDPLDLDLSRVEVLCGCLTGKRSGAKIALFYLIFVSGSHRSPVL